MTRASETRSTKDERDETMNALLNNQTRVVAIEVRGETRYYITMGHPGFNLRANNLGGYATAKAAEAASLRCEMAGKRARGEV
jgi:hypothetical protein